MVAEVVDRIKLCYQLPENLEIKVATTYQELTSALHLVHQSYLDRGYLSPTNSKMRLNLFHALPSTVTIIGKLDGRIIATTSIILDSFAGIPSEKVFSFSHLRQNFPVIAECSALAIDPSYRGASGIFLFPLLKFIYHYATRALGVDLLIANVNPKQERFYCEVLLFERTGGEVNSYAFAHGAPGTILTFNCQNAKARYHDKFHKLPEEKNLYNYFYLASFSQLQLPNFSQDFHLPRYLTPNMLAELFILKEKIINRLSIQDLLLLRLQYPQNYYDQCFFQTLLHRLDFSRREQRQSCFFPAFLNSMPGKIMNISASGCKFVLDKMEKEEQFTANSPWPLNLQVGEFDFQEWAVATWQQSGQLGLKIDNPSAQWRIFTAKLFNHYFLDEAAAVDGGWVATG